MGLTAVSGGEDGTKGSLRMKTCLGGKASSPLLEHFLAAAQKEPAQAVANQLNNWQGSPNCFSQPQAARSRRFPGENSAACSTALFPASGGLPPAPCHSTSGRGTSGRDTLSTSLLHIWELRALLHCAGAGRISLVVLFQAGPES